jgi:hypothetical protein
MEKRMFPLIKEIRMLRSIFALVLVLSSSATSFAMSPSEVKRSYEACMKFLDMSPAQQRKVAARSGHSLEDVQWACELQRENGLEKMQWCEIRYQTGHRYCD